MNSPILYKEEEPLLRVENVSLELDGNIILRDVNVTIRNITRGGVNQGQVVGFLGRSGIGKTQFFKILAGLKKPTSGQVLLGDPGVPVHKGMVGVVAQNYILFRHRTVLGNLVIAVKQSDGIKEEVRNQSLEKLKGARGARIFPRIFGPSAVLGRLAMWMWKRGLKHKEAIKRSMAMLERFKLTDKADFYPRQLSGGQRQRIAIAQQMLCDGHFLLMDEPFSGLDIIMKAKVAELINEIAQMHEKNTIIVVTHDVTEAASVADELWLMARDRDANGNEIPGANIKATYDLKERGLAWQPGITLAPEFLNFTREVKEKFMTL